MAAPRPFPWIYPYEVDETAARDGRDVLRPMVPIRLSGLAISDRGLIDSGSDHTLIAPYIARALGCGTAEPGEGFLLAVGGQRQWVTPVAANLELMPPDGGGVGVRWDCEAFVLSEWPASFGVLLGGRGFIDRFTVTMHRGVQAFAVDEYDSPERRFGTMISDEGTSQFVLPY